MKNKTISITDDNFSRLANSDNASRLINDLLDKFYEKTDILLMNKEELKRELQKRLINKKAKEDLAALDNG